MRMRLFRTCRPSLACRLTRYGNFGWECCNGVVKLHGPEEDASLPHEEKVIVEQDYRELFVYHVPYLEPDDERLNLHKPVAVTLEQAGTGAGVVMMLIVSDDASNLCEMSSRS